MKHGALGSYLACLSVALAAGIAVPLALTAAAVPTGPVLAVGVVYAVVLVLLLAIFVVETVSVFKIDDSTYHTALLAAGLTLFYAFSTDSALFFGHFGIAVPGWLFGIAGELAYAFVETCCCWYLLYLYRIKVGGRAVAVYAALSAVSLAGYAALAPFGYGYLAHFAFAALSCAAFGTVLFRAERQERVGITTTLIAAIFSWSAGAQSADALCFGGGAAAVPGLPLGFAVLTVCAFFLTYFAFSVRTDLRAVRSDEYKSQADSFRTRALTEQIKPHFIFNALEAVRSLYHADLAAGDEAVTRLSDFLRDSIKAFDDALIPFERELDTMFNYTEFENLKRENKVEVIFDIDCTDFSVPPFSVQPFVENALKYGCTEEGGRVIISSYREGNAAVVEITDEGRGFDPEAVSSGSHGIRNASSRFFLALGVTPEIASAPGEGTRVRIVIPQREKEEEA